MPYDIEKARLIKENVILRRQVGTLPEGAGWCESCDRCENCGYPSMADNLHEQMNRERRKHNAHVHQMEQSYQELSSDLDSCRAKAQKCQLKNKQLMKSTAGYFG